MLLTTLAPALALAFSPASAMPATDAALACNPSGPRPQHCGSALAVFDKPAGRTLAAAEAPRKFCHPDPSKNRGCTRVDPHAEALALRKAAASSAEAR